MRLIASANVIAIISGTSIGERAAPGTPSQREPAPNEYLEESLMNIMGAIYC